MFLLGEAAQKTKKASCARFVVIVYPSLFFLTLPCLMLYYVLHGIKLETLENIID
jgi:hypothetical protein